MQSVNSAAFLPMTSQHAEKKQDEQHNQADGNQCALPVFGAFLFFAGRTQECRPLPQQDQQDDCAERYLFPEFHG